MGQQRELTATGLLGKRITLHGLLGAAALLQLSACFIGRTPEPPPPPPPAASACETNNGGCDELAQCVSVDEEVSCSCPDGYSDSLGDGSLCEDIDECDLGSSNCDAVASCNNSPGAFVCTCPGGFTDTLGDGTVCVNIDECTAGTDDCAVGTTCADNPGGFDCECVASCDAAARCEVMGQVPTCICPSGYIDANRDGSSCVDLDECALGISGCAAEASCVNTDGDFTCSCPSGYDDVFGDATQCDNINECTLGTDGCSAEVVCLDRPGTYRCTCSVGELDLGNTDPWCVCPSVEVGVDTSAQVSNPNIEEPTTRFPSDIGAAGDLLIVGDTTGGTVTTANTAYNRSACADYLEFTYGDFSCRDSLAPEFDCCMNPWEPVDMCCETTVVSAAGQAHVYRRNFATGALDIEATLEPSNGVAKDSLGALVALGVNSAMAAGSAGSEIAVAAMGSDGPVYVYENDGAGGWDETAILSVASRLDSISTDGATIAIGANSTISFYAKGDGGAWGSAQGALPRPIWTTNNFTFAHRLDVDGDYAVAGSSPNGSAVGTATLFRRDSSTGLWSQNSNPLFAADSSIYFGGSVGISDGTLVVANACKVHVFELDVDESWIESASSPLAVYCGGAFEPEARVAVDHGRILVGTNPNGQNDSYAYVFDRQPNGNWLKISEYLDTDETGVDVAVSSFYANKVALGRSVSAVSARYVNTVFDYAVCQ